MIFFRQLYWSICGLTSWFETKKINISPLGGPPIGSAQNARLVNYELLTALTRFHGDLAQVVNWALSKSAQTTRLVNCVLLTAFTGCRPPPKYTILRRTMSSESLFLSPAKKLAFRMAWPESSTKHGMSSLLKQFLTWKRKIFHIISAQECHQKIKKNISDLMSTKIEKH